MASGSLTKMTQWGLPMLTQVMYQFCPVSCMRWRSTISPGRSTGMFRGLSSGDPMSTRTRLTFPFSADRLSWRMPDFVSRVSSVFSVIPRS